MASTLERLTGLQHVRGAVAVGTDGPIAARVEALDAEEVRVALALASDSRVATSELRARVGARVVLARGVSGFGFAVVADAGLDELDVVRAFNVTAIRLRAETLGARRAEPLPDSRPPSELPRLVPAHVLAAIENALVTAVGPIGRPLFRREVEGQGMDAHSVSFDDARALVERLAASVPAGARVAWRGAALASLVAAESARASRDSVRMAAAAPVAVKSSSPPSVPPAEDPRLSAITRALLEQVGPMGRLLVERALLDVTVSDPARANDALARVVDQVAAAIPSEARRGAFVVRAQAILGA